MHHYNSEEQQTQTYKRKVDVTLDWGLTVVEEKICASRDDIVKHIRHHFDTWEDLALSCGSEQDDVCFITGVTASRGPAMINTSVQSSQSEASTMGTPTKQTDFYERYSQGRYYPGYGRSPEDRKCGSIHFYMAKKNSRKIRFPWHRRITDYKNKAVENNPVTRILHPPPFKAGVRVLLVRCDSGWPLTRILIRSNYLRDTSGIRSETLSTTSSVR